MSDAEGRRTRVLGDMARFSKGVIGRPLYAYQLKAAQAVIESVRLKRGDEFLLVMARQSGKNETIAQLLVYLLNIYRRAGGSIVYGAIGDNIGRGLRRLEEHLDNPWNRGQWRRERGPLQRALGKAAVVFLSSHPQAHARGQTAHHLLVVDELQDQDPAHLQAVFQPMRAATNATAVYLGTVRTRHDALWRKKEELERLEAEDGRQRVFMAGPEAVCAENPRYALFLAGQIAQHGRDHPLIACEYFLQPLDEEAGLFPRRRLALMHGCHPRQFAPQAGEMILATLDVAGIDEGGTPTDFPALSEARRGSLQNPGRDYTTCTIFRVREQPALTGEQGIVKGPIYEAVDVFCDQGSRHFTDQADGRPSLAAQLLAFLRHWGISHLAGDATGVGEGLLNWLALQLGPATVTPFKFTRRSKAQLGVDFLALVETGRFKYWRQEREYDDAWWFYEQAAGCTLRLDPGRPMEQHLQWFVPDAAKVPTPAGLKPLHDDRLISAALIAQADRLIREGRILVGRAESAAGEGYDPLDDLPDW